jgi:predicted dehydrogenase
MDFSALLGGAIPGHSAISMNPITRRRFLQHSATASVAVAFSTRLDALQPGPNEQPHVALIGCGGRGSYVARGIAAAGARIVALCDLSEDRREQVGRFLERHAPNYEPAKVKQVAEMDKVLADPEVDAVIVATPDHWHALASIRAVQAGKDVYVEKPHSHNIYESRQMLEAARKYRRIIQVGTQNRSGAYNHAALEYIRSGQLGPIHLVKVFNLKQGGPFRLGPTAPIPPGFDWDAWLGPAPLRPYHPRIVQGGWHHYWDFSGGDLCDDAAHQTDLALMLMGDPGMPAAVSSAGGRLAHRGDDSEVPDLLVTTYEFDGFVLTLEHANYPAYMEKTSSSIRQGDEFPFWLHNATRIELYGSQQMMVVGRHGGGWQATVYPWEIVSQQYGRPCDDEHYADFVRSVKTRAQPNADIEKLHPSVCMLHMANVAHRVGNRKIRFDARTERFEDPEANSLLGRSYRAGYEVPEVV